MWQPPNNGVPNRARVYEALKGSAAAGGYHATQVATALGMTANNAGRYLRWLCDAGMVRCVPAGDGRMGYDFIRLDEERAK